MALRIFFAGLFVFSVAAPMAALNPDEPPNTYKNLNNKSYLAFTTVDEEGNPDPQGTLIEPLYIVCGQRGNKLYCNAVEIKDKEGKFLLASVPLGEGVVTGNEFDIKHISQDGTDTTIKGQVLAGGSLKTIHSEEGMELSFIWTQLDNNHHGGLYVGKDVTNGSAPAAPNDFAVGLVVDGNKMKMCDLAFDGSNEVFGSMYENIDFDPNTGDFSYNTNGQGGSIVGNITNGKLTADYTGFSWGSAKIELYRFDDKKQRKPKLFKVKPRKVSAGEVKLKVRSKRVNIGALLTLKNSGGDDSGNGSPEIYIRYFIVKPRSIIVSMQIDAGISGKYYFSITNPGGERSKSKKFIVQ